MTTIQSDTLTLPDNVPPDRVVDFDVYFDTYAATGYEAGKFQSAYTRLLENKHGVVWTPRNGGHWIAKNGELLKIVLKDSAQFSSECIFVPRERGEQSNLIPASMDPPLHRPFRKVFNAAVGTPVVRRIEADIDRIAIDLIESLVPRRECDFTRDYATIFPIEVFLKLIDLPSSDAPKLKRIADQVTRPDGTMSVAEAMEQFVNYIDPVINERRKNPGGDAISILATSEVEGRPLTQDECHRVVAMMLVAGLDTVVNFLSFMLQHLAENPSDRKLLIDNPDLIDSAAEELLRRYGLVTTGRLVTEDIEFDGVTLRKDDIVLIPTLMSGLDPTITKCPMDVDLRREKPEHIAFGFGIHQCAGTYLARHEITTTMREWLSRIPDFEVVPNSIIEYQSGVVAAVGSLPLRW